MISPRKTQFFRRPKTLAHPLLILINVKAALDNLTDAVCKIYDILAPPVSFGLYAGAELLFFYGLYRAYIDSQASQFVH